MSQFNSFVIGVLRKRSGLDESDSSEDQEILDVTPEQAFREVCGWTFGDQRWAGDIIGWLRGCGFKPLEPKDQ